MPAPKYQPHCSTRNKQGLFSVLVFFMALDYSTLRAVAQRAQAQGLIKPPPELPEELRPAAVTMSPQEVYTAVSIDLLVLNQVFSLRLNRAMSPFRMILAITRAHHQLTQDQRNAIPQHVLEMIEGLRGAVNTFRTRDQAKCVVFSVEVQPPDVALVRSANWDAFSRSLELTAGWEFVRKLLTRVTWHRDANTLELQGGLVGSCYMFEKHAGRHPGEMLSGILQSLQAWPADHPNLMGDIMDDITSSEASDLIHALFPAQ